MSGLYVICISIWVCPTLLSQIGALSLLHRSFMNDLQRHRNEEREAKKEGGRKKKKNKRKKKRRRRRRSGKAPGRYVGRKEGTILHHKISSPFLSLEYPTSLFHAFIPIICVRKPQPLPPTPGKAQFEKDLSTDKAPHRRHRRRHLGNRHRGSTLDPPFLLH